ncbi:hypothetical protein TWF730_007653 [Orbilia blumenaviensis]|uniref:Mitochondrial division protein 1 n=1 Tax=Orbilia blumenaviensis TaxID=1796055 RepID=A0AAV9VA75_9PEZI
MDGLSAAASVIALVQGIVGGWKIFSSIKDAKGEIAELEKELLSIKALAEKVRTELLSPNSPKLSTDKELNSALENCKSELERLEDKLGVGKKVQKPGPPPPPGLRDRLGLSFLKRPAKYCKWPLTGPEAWKIIANLKTWNQIITSALTIDQTVQIRKVNLKIDFAALPIAEGAAYGTYKDQHEPECLPNTRVDLLNDIEKWVENQQECVFWLSGVAGTGKSTISRTVAKRLQNKNILAASFFFRRGEKDRGEASKFFTTLAVQLANHIGDTIPTNIQKAIDENSQIGKMSHQQQFNKLIFEPLLELSRPVPPSNTPVAQSCHQSSLPIQAVLVIDALDECDREEDQELIVSLLAELKRVNSIRMRVFLTSRPELKLRMSFKKLSDDTHRDIILHEIPGIQEDITTFLEAEFAKIRDSYSLPVTWPESGDISRLATMAVPLFIFAATACRFIADTSPEDQIKIIMSYCDRANWNTEQLEPTYLPILHRLKADTACYNALIEDFNKIVGTIINLASPLSICSLSRLLSISETRVSGRLNQLHSVLEVPTLTSNRGVQTNIHAPVRMLHLSFRDFLSGQRLRENHEFCHFWIDEKEAHRNIYKRCVELMSNDLRMDICRLGIPGTLRSEIDSSRIEQYLPAELRYSCRYWVYHLQQSTDTIDDGGLVDKFLREHILHWLEAVSLVGEMSKMVEIVDSLNSAVDSENGKATQALVYDIKRFVRKNQSIINTAPLQTYWSALIYAPEKSIIKSIFNVQNMIPEAKKLPRVQEQWGAVLQTLEGHTSLILCVAFSANDKMLVSASHDRTVRIWDVATGALLHILRGHAARVQSVIFYNSGADEAVASGSADGTVRLWSAVTGVWVRTLERHTGGVNSVASTTDSKAAVLASASNDCTIRIWNSATGASLRILTGGSDMILSVAFSTDGKILASGSKSGTTMIWDWVTGELLHTLNHVGAVNEIAFSVNDSTLALAIGGWGDSFYSVEIADAVTGSQLRTLECEQAVIGIAFRTNSNELALVSYYGVITVWSLTTGAAVATQKIPDDRYLEDISLSTNNGLLAFTGINTIKIWDMTIGSSLPTLEQDSTNSIQEIKFSADGETVASVSSNLTVSVWKAATGDLRQTMEADSSLVTRADEVSFKGLAISSAGEMVALAFKRKDQFTQSLKVSRVVVVWDAATGVLLHSLEPAAGCVAFSPNGEMIASSRTSTSLSNRSTATYAIPIWSTSTGDVLHILEGHKHRINAIAFAADNITLASASDDHTVRIWDVGAGTLLRTLNRHRRCVNNVIFSPDSSVLASASNDRTIRVWDIATLGLLQIFKAESPPSISFSNDGRYIIDTQRDSDNLFLLKPSPPLQAPNNVKLITINNQWLVRGGERILWIPVENFNEYRVTHVPCLNLSLAIIRSYNSSGKRPQKKKKKKKKKKAYSFKPSLAE